MKSILLTTTAIVAFAGVAAADGHTSINFSGSAILGYNDTEILPDVDSDDDVGFYSELNLDVSMSATLDNGMTVTAAADVDELDAVEGGTAAGVTLTIATENLALIYGDTTFAAEDYSTAVGSMDADGDKAEQDGELVLKAAAEFNGITAAVSYELEDITGDTTGAGNLSFGAGAAVGMFNVALAYQSGDQASLSADTQSEMYGVKAGFTVAGADIAVGYFTDETADLQSTGISASYPVGPVTLAASYVMETVAGADGDANWDVSAAYAANNVTATVKTDESDDWAIEGTYDLGMGLKVAAGLADAGDDYYVGATYDLGGGATLLASYADDSDGDEVAGDNDIGAQDYQVGTTIQVSFKF